MVDWSRIDELRGEIGDEDFAEVVEMFLEEADEAVATLSPEMSAEDVRAALHFLKGSALNLGLDALAALCAEGERMAGRNEEVPLEPLFGSYAQSKAQLLGGLSDRTAA